MSISAADMNAAGMLLIGIGSLLGGLGIFMWGVRHLFFARRELDRERAAHRASRAEPA
jgi:hypothetical protein